MEMLGATVTEVEVAVLVVVVAVEEALVEDVVGKVVVADALAEKVEVGWD